VRFLLDTNVLIALAQRARSAPANFSAIFDPSNMSFVSAASLWEIAIKVRLRKLDAGHALEDLAGYFDAIGLVHLSICPSIIGTSSQCLIRFPPHATRSTACCWHSALWRAYVLSPRTARLPGIR